MIVFLHDSDQNAKQDILETAMHLFSERGLENVKIEDVVSELGVTRGAFYHYFNSREELISAVMFKFFEVNNPYVLVEKQKEMNALEKLQFIAKENLRPRLDMSDSMRKEIKKLSGNAVVFKNEMIFQVDIMSTYIEKLMIEGNIDGSMNVIYPRQAAQTISLLLA